MVLLFLLLDALGRPQHLVLEFQATLVLLGLEELSSQSIDLFCKPFILLHGLLRSCVGIFGELLDHGLELSILCLELKDPYLLVVKLLFV